MGGVDEDTAHMTNRLGGDPGLRRRNPAGTISVPVRHIPKARSNPGRAMLPPHRNGVRPPLRRGPPLGRYSFRISQISATSVPRPLPPRPGSPVMLSSSLPSAVASLGMSNSSGAEGVGRVIQG
jgi:hypothetical protein